MDVKKDLTKSTLSIIIEHKFNIGGRYGTGTEGRDTGENSCCGSGRIL